MLNILQKRICPGCGSENIIRSELLGFECGKCGLVFPDESKVEKVKKQDEQLIIERKNNRGRR